MSAALPAGGARPLPPYAPAAAGVLTAAAPPTRSPRVVVDVPGPAPTLYGIGAVARVRVVDIVEQLPGRWGGLVAGENRSRVLEPLLRLVSPGLRAQVRAALSGAGPAAAVESLLGREAFSAGAFAVWSGRDVHSALAARDPSRLSAPALFVTAKAPGLPSTMAALNAWDADRRMLQLGAGSPVPFPVPWSKSPGILLRNAYGGVVAGSAPEGGARVRANLMIGPVPPVPFSDRITGPLAGALRAAAVGAEVGNAATIVGTGVATRGASAKLAPFQAMVGRAIAASLNAGGAVAEHSTLYAGPAWHVNATGDMAGIQTLLRGERWRAGDVVVNVAGRSVLPADPLALVRALAPKGASAGPPVTGASRAPAAAPALQSLRAGLSPYDLAIAQAGRAMVSPRGAPAQATRNEGIPALRIAQSQVELAAKLGLLDREGGEAYFRALPATVQQHLRERFPDLASGAGGRTGRPPMYGWLSDIQRQGGPRNAAQAAFVDAIAQGFVKAQRASGRDVLGEWVRGSGARGAPLPRAAALEAAEPARLESLEAWLRARFGSNGLGLNFGWTRADGRPLIDGGGPLARPPGVDLPPDAWRALNRAWLGR
jgi:hypothetical protein